MHLIVVHHCFPIPNGCWPIAELHQLAHFELCGLFGLAGDLDQMNGLGLEPWCCQFVGGLRLHVRLVRGPVERALELVEEHVTIWTAVQHTPTEQCRREPCIGVHFEIGPLQYVVHENHETTR